MRGLTTADHLRNAIEHDGGFTFSPFRETPDSGYMVGVKGLCKMDSNTFPLTDGQLKEGFDILKKNPNHYFLGGWKDPETGFVYYDISEHFEVFGKARKAAIDKKEIALFDLETKREIKIKG